MTHECELCKSDKMQDLLADNNGNFYCKSCRKLVNYEDIHPSILRKYKIKLREK